MRACGIALEALNREWRIRNMWMWINFIVDFNVFIHFAFFKQKKSETFIVGLWSRWIKPWQGTSTLYKWHWNNLFQRRIARPILKINTPCTHSHNEPILKRLFGNSYWVNQSRGERYHRFGLCFVSFRFVSYLESAIILLEPI